MDKKEYKEALQFFQTTLEKAQQNDDIGNMVNAINNIGATNDKLGKFEIALQNKLAQEGVYVYVIEYQFADFLNGGIKKAILSGDLTLVK